MMTAFDTAMKRPLPSLRFIDVQSFFNMRRNPREQTGSDIDPRLDTESQCTGIYQEPILSSDDISG
jgi:hypothetical protein